MLFFECVDLTGNESKQVDLQGYQVGVVRASPVVIHCDLPLQVSNQCMALVRDDCLVPTLDAAELGYIRESTPEQLVPDVFYKVSKIII